MKGLKLSVQLRYYPGDLRSGILRETLDGLETPAGLTLQIEEVVNPATTVICGEICEETAGVPLEEISQTAISMEAGKEEDLVQALKRLFARCGSPRAPFGFWGSSPEGARLARRVAEQREAH